MMEQFREEAESMAVNTKVNLAGMSLRDYFAAQALAGMLSQPADQANLAVYDNAQIAAIWSYRFADAMLKEREKGGG